MDVIDSEALTDRSGQWPSFHDAEIYALRLDSGQRGEGVVRLELDIHVFAADGLLPSGRVNLGQSDACDPAVRGGRRI